MICEIYKMGMANINGLKEVKYKKYKGDIRYFLEERGNEVFFGVKKMTSDDFNNDLIFTTSKGSFLSVDEGEFGGKLYKVNKRIYEYICYGNFKELIDFDNKLFFVDSCEHMMGRFSYGFIEENNISYKINNINEVYDEYSIGCYIYNGEIYILTCSSLYKITGDDFETLEKIIDLKNDTSMRYLSIMDVGNTLFKDGKIYVGLNKRILVINIDLKKVTFLG